MDPLFVTDLLFYLACQICKITMDHENPSIMTVAQNNQFVQAII